VGALATQLNVSFPRRRESAMSSDQGLRQANDEDRCDGKCHQHPIGQKPLGCGMVAMTMFVSHVSSSFQTDPFGRFLAASQ